MVQAGILVLASVAMSGPLSGYSGRETCGTGVMATFASSRTATAAATAARELDGRDAGTPFVELTAPESSPLSATTAPPVATVSAFATSSTGAASRSALAVDGAGSASCADLSLAPPAVVDCHDPRMSLWVDRMIGSCDMPRGPAPPTLRALPPGRGSARCDGATCSRAGDPDRATHRLPYDPSPLAALSATSPLHRSAEPVVERAEVTPATAERAPPERPPRRLPVASA